MKHVIVRLFSLSLFSITILTACEKDDVLTPQPNPPVVTSPVKEGYFTIKLKAAITVGDVVYDSIPATFSINSWDANGVQYRKDTTLNAGAQEIQLPKAHSRYAFSVNKWGVEDRLEISKNEITEGHIYTLGGSKAAKKLQSVTEYSYANGAFVPSQRQVFAYDAQGRIKQIEQNVADESGVFKPGNKEDYIYNGNKLKIENVTESNGVRTVWFHHAYTFDALGRIIQSEFRYITEHQVFTNHYINNGINMLMGEGATDQNGSRIAIQFAGGNRVEEKTMIPGYATTVKKYTFDFNINPYAVIKMPSLYFEHSSKNNVLTESIESSDASSKEYIYDADGYVKQVVTKSRNSQGEYVTTSKIVFAY